MTSHLKQTRFINKLFRQYKWMVDDLGWDVNLVFVDEIPEEINESLANAQMFVVPQWSYLKANLCVVLNKIESFTKEDIEKIFLHELCHILISPMRENATAASEEYVATSLSRVMFRLKAENPT